LKGGKIIMAKYRFTAARKRALKKAWAKNRKRRYKRKKK